MAATGGISEVERYRALLEDEQQRCEEMQIELDAQRQVNSDVMANCERAMNESDSLRAQLHEERRQHENTSMKLADMLNALADRDFMQLEHENMQAVGLSDKCRQLDLRWQTAAYAVVGLTQRVEQEEHARNRALVDDGAMLTDRIKSNMEDILKYKSRIGELQRAHQLLQHEVDRANEKLLDYETRSDSVNDGSTQHGSKSTSKNGSSKHATNTDIVGLPRRSSSGGSSDHNSVSKFGGRGRKSVPVEQAKMMETTLVMVRNELRRALGEKEAFKEERDALKEQTDLLKNEIDTLVREKDKISLANTVLISQESKHVVLGSSRRGSLDAMSEWWEEKKEGQGRRDGVYTTDGRKEGETIDPPSDSSAPESFRSGAVGAVDVEEYRNLCAKFKNLSDVLEKEQLRRESLEAHWLTLRRSGQNERRQCEECVQRERERDREREESQLSVMDAKAAMLTSRSECGRLRADLNHSFDCLRAAEEAKILLERALSEQHQRYQRLCEKVQVQQADEQFHKLQYSLQTLQQQRSKEHQQHFLRVSRDGPALLPVQSPIRVGGHGNTGRKDGAKEMGGGGAGKAGGRAKSVEFGLYSTQSPVINVQATGGNSLFTSPSPSCAATPPYTSDGASLRKALRVTPSPSPATSTIFYTTTAASSSDHSATVEANSTHAITRTHASSRHSRLSADPTLPSLSLPEEMKDNPDGRIYTKGQENLRDSISASISKARQSSLPPRADKIDKEAAQTTCAAEVLGSGARKRSEAGADGGVSDGGGPPKSKAPLAHSGSVATESNSSVRVRGLTESAHSVQISNPSTDTPPRATPASVRTSPTVNMGVLMRSINPNGPMDFRAPSESPHWHFP